MEGGEDPHLAILAYATTPLNHSLPSPAELLNSRKYRCILPVQVKQQNHTHRYRNLMQRQKHQQTKYYNQKRKRLTQSQDWKASLCAASSKNKKLDTRTHHRKTKLKNIQNENLQWGNLHQEQKIYKTHDTQTLSRVYRLHRMTADSREQLEQSEHYQRPKRTTQKPQRLIEIMN